ncbi:MAG: c-type cytochrome [Gammaproteobacteria bacterium]|nr:c-type cytochrome [Gammaproteobacteria bacterium]MDD9896329.1 c-type cytochrome [Gammaproteobacteria bacterium]MDD9959236.1 c-type cytochrome [Gammaproteobacteria bacterium]
MLVFPRILLILALLSVGASCTSSITQIDRPFADTIANEDVMDKWSRSCALCHVSGVADAPLLGDAEEWRRRLAKGESAVMTNVLEGINSMPPLGYCMACEISDFRAMIGFMAGTNQ